MGSRHSVLQVLDGKHSQDPLGPEENADQGYPFFAVRGFHSFAVSWAARRLQVDCEGATGAAVDRHWEQDASMAGVLF